MTDPLDTDMNCARMYDVGDGIAKNYNEAARYYLKAAKLGDVLAMSNIGFMYQKGLGMTKNYAESEKWSRKESL